MSYSEYAQLGFKVVANKTTACAAVCAGVSQVRVSGLRIYTIICNDRSCVSAGQLRYHVWVITVTLSINDDKSLHLNSHIWLRWDSEFCLWQWHPSSADITRNIEDALALLHNGRRKINQGLSSSHIRMRRSRYMCASQWSVIYTQRQK